MTKVIKNKNNFYINPFQIVGFLVGTFILLASSSIICYLLCDYFSINDYWI